MKELKTDKKSDSGRAHSAPKRKSTTAHDIGEVDYVGSGYRAPEEFVPLAVNLSHPASETARAEALTQLQEAYGNKYVQKVLQMVSGAEAIQAGDNPEPDQLDSATETVSPEVEGIQTILRPGYSPQTVRYVRPAPPSGECQPAYDIVNPGGNPNVIEPGGENTCTPRSANAVLSWDVVSDGLSWRPRVTALTLSGTIRINPWPNQPNAMVVPNTSNPVDGGNINDEPTSPNYWETAAQDMENYDTAGGGAGPNWHCTEASRAHEWAHWNEDYVADAVSSATGGNWPAINAAIEALSVSKLPFTWTAAAGREALQPLVDEKMQEWRTNTINRWNNGIKPTDVPGGGGRGYAAGARVLAPLITRVRIYGLVLRARALITRILG